MQIPGTEYEHRRKMNPPLRLCPGTKSMTQIPGTDNQQQKKMKRLKDYVLGQNRLRFPGQRISSEKDESTKRFRPGTKSMTQIPGRIINSSQRWSGSKTPNWDKIDDSDSRDRELAAKKMNRLRDSILGQNRRRRFPGRRISSKERWSGSKTPSWDKIDDADTRDGYS